MMDVLKMVLMKVTQYMELINLLEMLTIDASCQNVFFIQIHLIMIVG